jgi:hypothetical protein
VTVLCSDAAGNTATTTGTVRVKHHDLEGGDDDPERGGGPSGKCCRWNDRDRRHGDNEDLKFFWSNELEMKGPGHGDRCYYDDDDDAGATLIRTN